MKQHGASEDTAFIWRNGYRLNEKTNTAAGEQNELSLIEIRETLTHILLKDVLLGRTFHWLVGRVAGLLVQPACTSQTDVGPFEPAAPQAVCVLEKPGDQMLLPGVPPACCAATPAMLQWPSLDLKLGFQIVRRQSC